MLYHFSVIYQQILKNIFEENAKKAYLMI